MGEVATSEKCTPTLISLSTTYLIYNYICSIVFWGYSTVSTLLFHPLALVFVHSNMVSKYGNRYNGYEHVFHFIYNQWHSNPLTKPKQWTPINPHKHRACQIIWSKSLMNLNLFIKDIVHAIWKNLTCKPSQNISWIERHIAWKLCMKTLTSQFMDFVWVSNHSLSLQVLTDILLAFHHYYSQLTF